MKKIIVTITALLLCVTLMGCGNQNTNSTMTDLCNQLDSTSNTISTLETVNPNNINFSKEMLETIPEKSSDNFYRNMLQTQQTLLNEEYFKTAILGHTAKIKNNISSDIKLAKSQNNAIRELTSNLKKYTNSITNTKNDMSTAIKNISSLKKNFENNCETINAKMNRINCNSNSRLSYYQNIISTLKEIEDNLNLDNRKNNEYQNSNSISQQNQINQKAESQTDKTLETDSNKENCCDNKLENCQNDEQCQQNNVEVKQTPYNTFNSNNINRLAYAPYAYGNYYYGNVANPMYAPYRNSNFGMNGMYGMNGIYTPNGLYGMNGFGMYGNYGAMPYNFYGNAFPNSIAEYNTGNMNFGNRYIQNTDTYAPIVRNIDTYRINPLNRATTVSNLPDERLENFEKITDDNTIEKIEDLEDDSEEEKETIQSNLENQNHENKFKIKTVSKNLPDDDLNQQTKAN